MEGVDRVFPVPNSPAIPFAAGTYQLTIQESDGGPELCAGDLSSQAVINGNTLKFTACADASADDYGMDRIFLLFAKYISSATL